MKRGDIYLLNLKHDSGSVQAGIRPLVIIQNDVGNLYSTTTIVCSITSANKKWLPTHMNVFKSGGLTKPSIVLCEQIFTVNKSDLQKHVGTITNPHVLERLNKCIKLSLELN